MSCSRVVVVVRRLCSKSRTMRVRRANDEGVLAVQDPTFLSRPIRGVGGQGVRLADASAISWPMPDVPAAARRLLVGAQPPGSPCAARRGPGHPGAGAAGSGMSLWPHDPGMERGELCPHCRAKGRDAAGIARNGLPLQALWPLLTAAVLLFGPFERGRQPLGQGRYHLTSVVENRRNQGACEMRGGEKRVAGQNSQAELAAGRSSSFRPAGRGELMAAGDRPSAAPTVSSGVGHSASPWGRGHQALCRLWSRRGCRREDSDPVPGRISRGRS